MKYTVLLPRVSGLTGDVGLVSSWRKEIGEAVQSGDILAVVGGAEVVSPAFGILARKVVLPGEAIEVGEPLAILSGVPEEFVTGAEAISEPFALRPPYIPGGPEEIVPLSPVRQAIARHMARSIQESPHVVTVLPVDMSEVMRLAARVGVPVLPFVLSAAASALKQFPDLNAERVGYAEVRRKQYVHIAVPVRRADERLVVPVLRDTDRKSIRSLAREWEELRAQAVAGTLSPDAQRGATFTVVEVADALYQTPVLHQPQSAILSMGAVTRTPVAADDDTVTVRPVAHLCLAHDARVADGETAAAFLQEVRRHLEEARFLFA
jgi:pyruvate/2-oxoglutarate dehydrogenase complex dihydrolipoamide acyltransferase (E2) component